MTPLPEDIEHEIVKLAVEFELSNLAKYQIKKADPKGLLNLTLVAHRVNNWVRSICFRFSILGCYRPYKMFSRALCCLPPSFFPDNVTSLLVLNSTPTSVAHHALELCTNVDSLAYWNSRVPQNLLVALPLQRLRRLSMPVDLFSQLCDGATKPANSTCFTHTLRELALVVSLPDEDIEPPSFGVFPSLTHFALSTVKIGSLVPKLVRAMLAAEKCQVVVLQGDHSAIIDDARFAVDRRFVYQLNQSGFLKEWKELEESRNGFWARAEREIAGR